MKPLYYGAYGSNLNRKQMLERCPASQPLEASLLEGYMLVFKEVADIKSNPESSVPIGIYTITRACEKALDRYEGFPRLYRKEYFEMDLETVSASVMIYTMNEDYGCGEPPRGYVEVIDEGYRDWGFDRASLDEGVKFSIKNADGTSYRSGKWSS